MTFTNSKFGIRNSKIFLVADHGLAVIYFLQSDVLPTLLESGAEIIVLTDDALVDGIAQRFERPGVTVAGMRTKQLNQYAAATSPETQWWLHFLRRVGSSRRINTQAMDSYVAQVAVEEGWKRRIWMPAARAALWLLRRSRRARSLLVNAQNRYNPQTYADLFAKYNPALVVASTYGWRLDRYLLREAAARGVPTAAAIVGWDNPSSYGLTCTNIDWVTCWSQTQKDELTLGGDWPEERVHIGGIPSYDGYFRREWEMPRDEYFALHHLDPQRKLIAYAASFISFAPNFRNIETLARLVASDSLSAPSQLLIRLHPNHFGDAPLFAGEREQIRKLARELPHIHVVEPAPLVAANTASGGALNYYSGEDMPEKASMMAHADVFATVYSTMVVETAIHDTPIVSVCLDTPGGWNTPRKFSLPLSAIGNWPTHERFRQAGAGQVVTDEDGLRQAIDRYLQNPQAESDARRAFISREVTFTDGGAGRRTGDFLAALLDKER